MRYFLLLFIFINSLFANQNQSFENFVNSQNREFQNYKTDLEEGFKEYKKSLNEGFEKYKKELSNYWKNPELSTKTTFVEYSKDKKVRKKIDYKNNFVKIDVIAKNKKEAQKEMVKSFYSLSREDTNDAFTKNPVLSSVNKKMENNPKLKSFIKNNPPSKEPLIADMIFKTPPTTKEVVNYSIKKIKNKPIKVEKSKLPEMKVYSIKIHLPPKGYLKKAKIFKLDVLKRGSQFKLPPEFIFAIIQTESSFNPMARSYIPAFGLMQIVPQTAGADAYKMLTGKKRILTPSYLYNSHNNILIGSAYLKKIYYGYFRGIKDPTSRLYCTITAYNTGIGNVACAFNSISKKNGVTICSRKRGDYNIKKAVQKINKLSSDEVYTHLLQNLKYDEPKNYLKRVRKRYLNYKKVLEKNEI